MPILAEPEEDEIDFTLLSKLFFADGKGCDWLITAPEGHIVALEFEYFMVRFKRI